MRVVGLQELCSQPEGAIFSEYDPCIVQGLYRFGSPIETAECNQEYYKGKWADFFYHDLCPSPIDTTMGLEPKDHKFHDLNHGSRWGKFEPDELFVLYEEEDVKKLLALIGNTE